MPLLAGERWAGEPAQPRDLTMVLATAGAVALPAWCGRRIARLLHSLRCQRERDVPRVL